MMERLREVLERDPRVAFALLFGSEARGLTHAHSDVDVAVSMVRRPDAMVVGEITSDLERAAGRSVHLVLLDDAPPGLAYRIFREAKPILIRDRAAFRARLARAILDYLDFKPVEDLLTRGVLRARHGR